MTWSRDSPGGLLGASSLGRLLPAPAAPPPAAAAALAASSVANTTAVATLRLGCATRTEKAEQLLGWRAEYTVADGVRHSLAWAEKLPEVLEQR